jgi:predicted ATPase/DNA-binding XRE family transcriptional regulator
MTIMSGISGTLIPDNFNNFGELLRYLRERAELSQRELALQVGYHYSYMSRIEKNERMPDSATLMARFIPALRLDDEPQWTERLLKLAASEEKTISPRRTGQSPASHPPVVASSLPTFDLPLNPLPLSLTPLLGREDEVEAVTKIVARPDVRLVTLVGAPGVGKTRLAIHTANELAGLFAHGAAFVDLSPVIEPKDVLPALANALGVNGSSDVPLMTQVISTLKQKNLLFVIDNFEHVIDASPQLVQLLGNAPQVKVLVTSREALRISGEHEFAVEPLSVPGQESVTGLIDYAAVQLFAQRAQAVDQNFRLTPENLKTISEICRRLDGLPLAIELAAARAKFISPQAMLAQFDRRLDWVAHGTRDVVSSRQTLRGAIEWSYNTLSEQERVLLRRLSVFSGGWNADSAEAVCGDAERDSGANPVLRRGEVLNLLIQLTDKSIVLAEKYQDETRFRFLETIHEYAREKLEGSGEAVEIRNRHLAHYADLAESIEAAIDSTDQIKGTLLGDQEHNNFRAALDWGLQEGAVFQNALRIAAAVSVYWVARSYFREGIERLGIYLSRATETEHQLLRMKLLYRAGAMAGYMFDHATGRKLCEQGVELARVLGSKRDLANALFYLSEIASNLGLNQEARAALDECISLCSQENYTSQLSVSLTDLGVLLNKEGNFKEAQSTLEEALAISTRTNDLWGIGHALLSLGSINRFERNYDASIDYFVRSLAVTLKIGDRRADGITYSNLALLYFIKEDYEKSGECAEKSFAVFQAMGNEYQTPYPLRMMGYSAIHAGNLVRARVLVRESLIGNYTIVDILGQLACLVGMAYCDQAEQDHKSAVRLCALAETQREQQGFNFLEPDAIVSEDIRKQCKKKLGKAAYESAYQEGQALKLDGTLMKLMAE